MQETIAPDRMGRAFSLIGSLSSATMPLGLLIAGPVAENRGVSLRFFVSGTVLLLLTLFSIISVLHLIQLGMFFLEEKYRQHIRQYTNYNDRQSGKPNAKFKVVNNKH